MNRNFGINFAIHYTVDVVQLVRMSDCGSEGRGFESHLPPEKKRLPSHNGGAALFFNERQKPAFVSELKNKGANPAERREAAFSFWCPPGSPSKR